MSQPNILDNVKKIHFLPNCNYPRIKLSVIERFSRVNKKEKADCIVLPNITPLLTYHLIYFLDVSTATLIKVPTYDCFELGRALNPGVTYNQGIEDGKEALCRLYSKVYPDLKIIKHNLVTEFSDDDSNMLQEVLHSKTPFVTQEQLSRYIDNTLPVLTTEEIVNIDAMFKSSDSSVQGLALKHLANFNVCASAGQILRILYQNYQRLYDVNEFKSVLFQSVLISLGITNQQLKSYDELQYLNHAYTVSSTEEDKEFIRCVAKELINNVFSKYIRTLSRAFKDLPIECKINLLLDGKDYSDTRE